MTPTELDSLALLTLSVVDQVCGPIVAARNAGTLDIDTKSSGTDMVTEMDRWSEDTIIAAISRARPDDGFVGEEGGHQTGSSGVMWIIDPIDGTTNYLYDVPGFSVSIAAEVDGQVMVGVVADPVRDEVFSAIRGQGAHRNGRPVRCSDKPDLATALIGTGFGYDASRRVEQASVLVDVIGHVRDVRRMGGAALDLCAVACGRLDGFYERGLAVWDVAAGGLIASEAGALVTDLDGVESWSDMVVCAGPALHPELVGLLRAAHR
ncbi:MAG: inositol monophosphatase family protein [Acidimicrobiales bacterium]